jgi:hypothetical protein
VEHEAFESFFGSNCHLGWATFRRHYPKANSLVRISGVGFNQSRNRSAVYIAVTHVATARINCLGSVGFALLFKRENGRWVFDREIDLWIS